MKEVKAYCDGSCNNATGQNGGFGVTLKYLDKVKEIAGGQYINTTSSRMELLAAITALESIKSLDCYIKVHSDSQYVVNSISKGWVFTWEQRLFRTDTGEDRPNADLWRRFLIAYRRFPERSVKFIWIKGHDGHIENERCDALAKDAGKLKTSIEDDRNGMYNTQKLIKK